jgi:hypothetical protein
MCANDGIAGKFGWNGNAAAGNPVVGLREGYDDSEQNDQKTRALLRQYPKLAGILQHRRCV